MKHVLAALSSDVGVKSRLRLLCVERSRDKKSAQLLRGVFVFFGLSKVSTLGCGSRHYEAT